LPNLDLAILIPAWNERPNIEILVPQLQNVLETLGVTYEIIVADANSADGTAAAAERLGARVVQQVERGYGGALMAGFAATTAARIITMDADLSHPHVFVESFWKSREQADVLIASRYVPGGSAEMPGYRYALSRILNTTFTVLLLMPIKDLSSGFRMYRRETLDGLEIVARDFDVLQELIIRIYVRGFRVRELPFRYLPRGAGVSHARLWKFGKAYVRTLPRMMRLRFFKNC
jgi:dolichol-phosphate mannosyltransferase